MKAPVFDGNLRKNIVRVPEAINQSSGICILGRMLKSFIFSTDVAIIRNCNADAIMAVYPFTPQPIISHALMLASDNALKVEIKFLFIIFLISYFFSN